jgi:hypothetical protein
LSVKVPKIGLLSRVAESMQKFVMQNPEL